jgi:HK97 family phage major capsid protein
MLSKLLPESCNRAIGLCSPTALPQLLQLKDGTGRAVALITQGANGRPQLTIGHVPLFVTEKLPALGTTGDFGLFDFGWYDISDFASLEEQAQGIYRSLDIHLSDNTPTYFARNQSAFRIAQRVAGQPRIAAPLTLQDTTTQVSPFVILN